MALWISNRLRFFGARVIVLSEYVREQRIPDTMIFDGKKLTALEVEREKRWKSCLVGTSALAAEREMRLLRRESHFPCYGGFP